MNIIIVGNGKVGYTLAQYLSKDGHDITILDRSQPSIFPRTATTSPYWTAASRR